MTTHLLLSVLAPLLPSAALHSSILPQAAPAAYAGTYYKPTYIEDRTQTVKLSPQGGALFATLGAHRYRLYRRGGEWIGSVPATVQEVRQNLGYGGSPLSVRQATAAVSQGAAFFTLEIEGSPDASGTLSSVLVGEEFRCRSFVADGRTVNVIPDGIQVKLVWPRVPEISAGFDFAQFVRDNEGYLAFHFADVYGASVYKWNTGLSGHNYVAINLVAKGVRRAVAFNAMKNRFPEVFPFTVRDRFDRTPPDPIHVGAVYTLDNGKLLTLADRSGLSAAFLALSDHNQVEVENVSAYDFTFRAIPGEHVLRGTAVHGLFEDAGGNVYMYQMGRDGEGGLFRSAANVAGAGFVWKRFANNLGRALGR